MNIRFALFLLLCSCQGQTTFKADPKSAVNSVEVSKAPQTPMPQMPSMANDEGIDIPQNIAGSYLFCAERKRATDADPESEFGCRLNDKETDQKLELADSSVLSWSSSIPENVTVDANSTNPAWHAIYKVRGQSFAEVKTLVRAMKIQVEYVGEAPAPISVFDKLLKEVLGAITDSGDEEAPILTQGIDPKDTSTY